MNAEIVVNEYEPDELLKIILIFAHLTYKMEISNGVQ